VPIPSGYRPPRSVETKRSPNSLQSPHPLLAAPVAFPALENKGVPINFKTGEVLCTQGRTSDVLYMILDGWIKLYTVSPIARKTITGIRGSGWIVGLESWVLHEPSLCSVVALSDSRARRFSRAEFAEFVITDVNVHRFVRSQLDSDALAAIAQEIDLMRRSEEERYEAFRAEIQRPPFAGLAEVVTQRDLALILDVTLEHLSRLQRRFAGSE
jgi:CRP-like cAMP-binding protein